MQSKNNCLPFFGSCYCPPTIRIRPYLRPPAKIFDRFFVGPTQALIHFDITSIIVLVLSYVTLPRYPNNRHGYHNHVTHQITGDLNPSSHRPKLYSTIIHRQSLRFALFNSVHSIPIFLHIQRYDVQLTTSHYRISSMVIVPNHRHHTIIVNHGSPVSTTNLVCHLVLITARSIIPVEDTRLVRSYDAYCLSFR